MSQDSCPLDWLIGRHFEALERIGYEWFFCFENKTGIKVACLWRLLEAGGIHITSADDGHPFGLPAPLDGAEAVNRRIPNATVETIHLRENISDLTLHFNTGHVLEIIPDSSSYKPWQAWNESQEFIATGGGEIHTIHRKQN